MESFARTDGKRHIHEFIGRGTCDLIHELAEPVPAATICRPLGINAALDPEVRETRLTLFAAQPKPKEFGRRQAALPEVTIAEMHDRRINPRDHYRTQQASIVHAVEEALRLYPLFLGFFQRTTHSVAVSAVDIPAQCDVYMGRAAANRDPKVFPAPGEFQLSRYPNRHLSFGFGIHSCPGAALARLELQVLLEELFRRIPNLRVASDPPV